MITPNKFTKLSKSVVFTVALIIRSLKVNNEAMKYDKLYQEISNELGDNALYLYIPALDILFLLGKITYNIEKDTVELIL